MNVRDDCARGVRGGDGDVGRSNLQRQRRGLPLTELVRREIDDAVFFELALTPGDDPPGGGSSQAAANVLKVADQASAFTVAGGGGLRVFSFYLDQSRTRSSASPGPA